MSAPRMTVKKKGVQVNERGLRIGESHPKAKLTDAEVESLLDDREAGMSLGNLALKWGMSKSGVKAIVDGRNRCHVGTTELKAPTHKIRSKRVKAEVWLTLYERALMRRLGGNAWVRKMLVARTK